MIYKVNKQRCTGCQACLQTCPGAARMGIDNKAEIINQNKLEECGGESICPFEAIEETGTEQEAGEAQPQYSTSPTIEKGTSPNQGAGRGLGMGTGRGQGRGAGRGQSGSGQGRGGGGVSTCVCPNCGYQEPHQRGVPCVENTCLQCGAKLVGKR